MHRAIAFASRLRRSRNQCVPVAGVCPGGTRLARCDFAGDASSSRHDAEVVQQFLFFSRIAGLIMVAVALLVLLGWSHDLPILTAVVPGQATMKNSAAIGFLMGGGALFLAHQTGRGLRLASGALSLSLLLLGTTVLVEYRWAADLGIDLLFHGSDAPRLSRPPGRMAELAAAGFVLLGGIGMLVIARRWLWLRDGLAVGAIAIAMVGMASYGVALAGQDEDLFSQLPIHTTVMLLLAALGWMSSVPTTGLTRIATADSLGGVLARRLLLPSLLLPAAFSFAFKALQSHLGASEAFALALAALFTGGTVAWMIWWVAALLDRVERQRQEFKLLRNDATTDVLTGLVNRRGFDTAIAELQRRKRLGGFSFSLLLVDLDCFKNYNDQFGHLAGDEALHHTGGILQRALRPMDIAARYGGEEFAVLLPEASAQKANTVALRIIEGFRNFDWPQRPITASIGVAEALPDETALELIDRADRALYESKRAGRDRIALAEPTHRSAA